MALLTNINGKFSVSDAGAVTFNDAFTFPTADGTANYVLQTNGSGQISWAVNGNGDITGSGTANTVTKFTGAKAIGNGPITFSGTGSVNSTFAGEITSGDDINTPTKIVVGESAAPEVRLKKTNAGNAKLSFYNNDGSSSTQQSYLSLDATENIVLHGASGVGQYFYAGGVINETKIGANSTFAGNVTANNVTLDNILLTPATLPAVNTPSISLRSTNNEIYFQAGSANVFNFIKADYTTMLALDGANSATFAGTVTATGRLTVNTGGGIAAYFNGNGSNYTQGAITLQSSNESTPEARGQGVFMYNQGTDTTWYTGTTYNNADRFIIGRATNASLNTEAARIDNAFVTVLNSGKVGIGTASPAVNLQVEAAGPPTIAQSSSISITSGTRGDLAWYNSSVSTVANIRADVDTSATADNVGTDLAFFTRAIGGSLTQKMVIKGGGNVGIGATSPEQKLHVEGRGIFDGGTSSDILQIRNNSGGGVFGMSSNLFALDLASTSAFRIRQGSSVPFYLKSNGNVGIGTTSPNQKLEVAGNIRIDSRSKLGSGEVDNITFTKNRPDAATGTYEMGAIRSFTTNGYSGGMTFYCGRHTGSGAYALISTMTIGHTTDIGLANVGIGTTTPSYKLDVDGTIRATGDVIAYSDVRVKENIKTIDNSLEKVSKLRGVEFNKIGNNEKSIGVIAQEIEKVIPEVVKEDDKGMKSVAYGNISGLLIEAIKELKAEIEELKLNKCNCNK